MRRGMSLTINRTVRRIPMSSINARSKNTHRGDFTRALIEAREAGFTNTLLLTQDGYIAEGPNFNVMAIVGGTLIAPDDNVLEGISCRTMMELAEEIGIPNRYGKLTPADIYRADEVFITATSCGLFPVTRVDDTIYGNGRAGPKAVQLLNLYYKKKRAGWHITPVSYDRQNG
jgi:branched-chain amino acid aminotransferase